MLPSERKQRILALLKERHDVSVQALAELLQAPAASVRRDLRELEAENRIQRRHGRALHRPSLVPAPLEEETALEPQLLDELVDETASLLDEARNLFLTGGPVLVRAARKLSGKTVATHDLALAMAAAAGDNDVTLVGRALDNRTLTLRSPSFESELASFRFDAAVVEVEGIDESSLWVARRNWDLLPALLPRSDSLVAIARSSSIGRKGDRVLGPLGRADLVVMDRGASAAARSALGEAGTELRVAGSEDALPLVADRVGNVFLFKRIGPGRPASAALELDEPEHDGPGARR